MVIAMALMVLALAGSVLLGWGLRELARSRAEGVERRRAEPRR